MTQHGTICHVEIAVLQSKQKEIQDFYHQVFGWNIDFSQLPNYGLTTNLDISVGMPLVEELSFSKSNVYIEVDDIDTCLDKIQSLGGAILSAKNKISDEIGFGASFTDLSGMEVGLFAPS